MTNDQATIPAAMTTADTSKPILADKYKTKMCRNFVNTGACPYESRCMFAHGEAELRTKEMNLHDGLVTEEAIRAFRRGGKGRYDICAAEFRDGAGSCQCAECFGAAYPGAGVYTHDPYSWYEYPCECDECAAYYAPWAMQDCDCPECTAAAHYLPTPPPYQSAQYARAPAGLRDPYAVPCAREVPLP